MSVKGVSISFQTNICRYIATYIQESKAAGVRKAERNSLQKISNVIIRTHKNLAKQRKASRGPTTNGFDTTPDLIHSTF